MNKYSVTDRLAAITALVAVVFEIKRRYDPNPKYFL